MYFFSKSHWLMHRQTSSADMVKINILKCDGLIETNRTVLKQRGNGRKSANTERINLWNIFYNFFMIIFAQKLCLRILLFMISNIGYEVIHITREIEAKNLPSHCAYL